MSDAGMIVAAVQMSTGPDVEANIGAAGALVAEAVGRGARLVVLPERWNLIDVDARQVAGGESLEGPSLCAARRWAREHAITMIAGSITEEIPGVDQTYNTSVMIDATGTDVAVYRKLHLFDVEVGGRTYRESDSTVAGDAIVAGDVAGHGVGMSICYDLRFPELYRALTAAGAEVLVVPAAFTATTGAAHWEPLLRARAIENQCFVMAAGQVGTHATGAASHGHTMIIDPWGVVLAESHAAGPDVVVATLDFGHLGEVRTRLPALHHGRDEVYGRSRG